MPQNLVLAQRQLLEGVATFLRAASDLKVAASKQGVVGTQAMSASIPLGDTSGSASAAAAAGTDGAAAATTAAAAADEPLAPAPALPTPLAARPKYPWLEKQVPVRIPAWWKKK